MGLFGSRRTDTVAGRAALRPGSFRQNVHSGSDNYRSNDLSHRGHVKLPANLELLSVDGGGPSVPGVQEVQWKVANWVRLLVTGLDDGSGRYEEAPDPASIQIPVRVDPKDGRIVEVDNDAIEAELEPWRELARDLWKRTEGVTRSIHQLGDLKDFARQGIPDIANEMRSAMSEMRADLASPAADPTSSEIPAAEIQQRLSDAEAQRAALASSPATIEMMRSAMVPQLRQQAQFVRDGHYAGARFDLDVECHLRSGLLDETEVAELRALAGTPGLG